ncbi:NAD(P)H-binding protein [Dactylosporangium sp. NPDC000244]|uniref:NAD(P)-dependent oxidoreductase n=1 Tax=Dactylosporangium sp. NPDC000244 TaxID=3154365 RepID=UPI003321B69B
MRIVVFGGNGRVGRAVVAEAVRRGHAAVALGRRAEVTDAEQVRGAVAGCDAVVSTVTPASGPQELARLGDAFDGRFFARAADALLAARPPRLVVVGLFATLRTAAGGLVLDDPAAFPAALRPFALAHLAGLDRLRADTTGVDWAVLTPTAGLTAEGPRTGRYTIGGETVPDPDPPLSHADLAVAVLDEIEDPGVRRGRVSVHGR